MRLDFSFKQQQPSVAVGSVPSLSGHAVAYRWHSLPRVRRHRATSTQSSSSYGCCLGEAHRYTVLYTNINHHVGTPQQKQGIISQTRSRSTLFLDQEFRSTVSTVSTVQ